MWICTNKAFLSIVTNPLGPDLLLVRARVKGHIESVFPDAMVDRVPGRDYLYRANIRRAEVGAAMAAMAMGIQYPNFKNSVKEPELKSAYGDVWHTMGRLQYVRPYGNDTAAIRRREQARFDRKAPPDPFADNSTDRDYYSGRLAF